MQLQGFIKPINLADDSDNHFLIKIYRHENDWQTIILNDGEETVVYWFSVWSDNVKGSLDNAIKKTAARHNLLVTMTEFQQIRGVIL